MSNYTFTPHNSCMLIIYLLGIHYLLSKTLQSIFKLFYESKWSKKYTIQRSRDIFIKIRCFRKYCYLAFNATAIMGYHVIFFYKLTVSLSTSTMSCTSTNQITKKYIVL